MSMQFRRAVEDMEIWSANSDGFSFVISYETSAGHGFHGHPGYVASWRPLDERRGAIKIGGSPFKTFADAEEACNTAGVPHDQADGDARDHARRSVWIFCGDERALN